jgi:hypothetical protein
MRKINTFILFLIMLMVSGCGSVEKLAKHDFDSGYFTLKTPGAEPVRVYAELKGDSMDVYPVVGEGREKFPDTSLCHTACISLVKPGDYLFKSTFRRNSFDVDLSTVLMKYRLPQKEVPRQLNANLNAALFIGLKKDYFQVKSKISPLHETHSKLSHFGFDAGFFAGIGITPVNYTVTDYHVELEYDGVVFQKGIAVFFGIDFLSFGIALGFDNLLDDNHKYWVYNQKPWIGLMLGIANF